MGRVGGPSARERSERLDRDRLESRSAGAQALPLQMP